MNDLGLLLLMSAIALLWARNMQYAVWFLATQGVLLSVMVWTSTPLTPISVLVAMATLGIKGLLIPGLIHRIMRTWPERFRQDYPLPLWAYALAVGLVLSVGHVIQLLGPTALIQHVLLFFYALSSIHLGFVMIVARRHLLSQLVSLVAIENALVVLAVSVAGSLPTFVELGMLIDIGIAATLMVWMSHRIHHQLQTTDVVALRRLRG
jgi:hydrogenase-4 component E